MSPALQLSGVTKRYGSLTALHDVTLSLAADQYVTLLGPSGSGKTTLLRVIAGFEDPDAGHVVLQGRHLTQVPAHRRGIGFVFQNFALFPHLTVEQNVAFGLLNGERERLDSGAARRRARDMIALVGLSGLEGRGINQISGGQRQRVALARTLVTEPGLVLLDEPLGALDANLRTRMRGELRAIRERLGVTFLHVTGSETEALAMGDSIVVLDAGRIAQVGSPDSVYDRPATPKVARYLNCYNLFRDLPGAPGTAAVRYDRIEVRPLAAPLSEDESRIEGRFVASEYAGASVLSYFAVEGGMVEVEAHLSHRAPPAHVEGERYALVWRRQDAIHFPTATESGAAGSGATARASAG